MDDPAEKKSLLDNPDKSDIIPKSPREDDTEPIELEPLTGGAGDDVEDKKDVNDDVPDAIPLDAEDAPNSLRRQAFEDNELIEEQAQVVTQILIPVAITMVIVVLIVRSTKSVALGGAVGGALPYSEHLDDSVWARFGGAIVNALVFVAIIIGVTVVFVLLYYYRCLMIIYAWLLLSTGMMLGFFGAGIFGIVMYSQNLPLDWITLGFLSWNFAVVGLVSIFWHASLRVNQAYLIAVSIILATVFTQLPEWTTWCLLAAIAIYDLFAVLCPKGPLKVLVETAQERDEPIPALIYSASVWMLMAQGDADAEPERKRGVKLGLGDFVFYSVLVGRAALFDMLTVFTCFIAVITGLFMTILLLAFAKKALPALPISIALGIIFFFLAKLFLLPMVIALGSVAVFI